MILHDKKKENNGKKNNRTVLKTEISIIISQKKNSLNSTQPSWSGKDVVRIGQLRVTDKVLGRQYKGCCTNWSVEGDRQSVG